MRLSPALPFSTAAMPITSTRFMPATRPIPQAVDAQWRSFFESLKDDGKDVAQNAQGASWQRADWPPLPRGDLVAALDGDWDEIGKTVGEKLQAKAQAKDVELARRPRPAGDPGLGARADADPGLPHARPSARQSRSAGSRAAQGSRGTRPPQLRLCRRRSRPSDLSRPRARARIRNLAADRGDPPAHLLPDAGGRVHAHLRSAAEGLDPGTHRRARQGDQLHPRGQARDPQQAGRGRRLREVLRREVHGNQAVRPRRRRIR